MAAAEKVLAAVAVGDLQTDGRTVVAPIRGAADVLRSALDRFAEEGVDVGDVGLRLPTLDEVFLSLTGHHADDRSVDGDGPDPVRPVTAGDDADLEVSR